MHSFAPACSGLPPVMTCLLMTCARHWRSCTHRHQHIASGAKQQSCSACTWNISGAPGNRTSELQGPCLTTVSSCCKPVQMLDDSIRAMPVHWACFQWAQQLALVADIPVVLLYCGDLRYTCMALHKSFALPPDQLFDWIEEIPVACGSIGQVHRAQLSEKGAALACCEPGELVAVKVSCLMQRAGPCCGCIVPLRHDITRSQQLQKQHAPLTTSHVNTTKQAGVAQVAAGPDLQVSCAVYLVQVRHPGVSDAIERDFQTMVWVAHVASQLFPSIRSLRLEETLKQFAAPLHEQVRKLT